MWTRGTHVPTSCEDFFDRFSDAVLRDVKRAAFDHENSSWAHAHRGHDRGVEIGEGDGIFDGNEGALVSSRAIEVPLLDAATKHHDTAPAGEVTVESVVFHLSDVIDFMCGLIIRLRTRLAFHEGIAAELGRDDNEGAIKESALFEVEDELGDRLIDLLVETGDGVVAIGVGIPVEKGDILGRDFDKAGTVFDEAAGEEATATEASGVVFFADFFRLFLDIKGVTLFGVEEPVGVVH